MEGWIPVLCTHTPSQPTPACPSPRQSVPLERPGWRHKGLYRIFLYKIQPNQFHMVLLYNRGTEPQAMLHVFYHRDEVRPYRCHVRRYVPAYRGYSCAKFSTLNLFSVYLREGPSTRGAPSVPPFAGVLAPQLLSLRPLLKAL
jgi:hypothetical protein